MKKRLLTMACVSALCFGTASAVHAYSFSDTIDYWNVNTGTYSSVYIDENYDILNLLLQPNAVPSPFTYTHVISDSVDFANGHYVTEAWLELDFTDFDLAEIGDSTGNIFGFRWDNRENVKYTYNNGSSSWIEIDSDNDIQTIGLDLTWLNIDGTLSVTVNVSNSLGTGDIGLDKSTLYGTAVPEPTTMLLFGTGIIGLAAVSRRKSN